MHDAVVPLEDRLSKLACAPSVGLDLGPREAPVLPERGHDDQQVLVPRSSRNSRISRRYSAISAIESGPMAAATWQINASSNVRWSPTRRATATASLLRADRRSMLHSSRSAPASRPSRDARSSLSPGSNAASALEEGHEPLVITGAHPVEHPAVAERRLPELLAEAEALRNLRGLPIGSLPAAWSPPRVTDSPSRMRSVYRSRSSSPPAWSPSR